MTTIYRAVARYGPRDAGHVCYARTPTEARAKALRSTTMTIVIRREQMTDADIAALTAVGKLERS